MDNKNEEIQELYTVEEVAKLFKVNPESVRRWVRKEKIKSIKLGGKFIRMTKESINDFLKESARNIINNSHETK